MSKHCWTLKYRRDTMDEMLNELKKRIEDYDDDE
jgi:hypothetical protein